MFTLPVTHKLYSASKFHPSSGGNPALKGRVFSKNNVGASTKLGPNLIPALKAWVHWLLFNAEPLRHRNKFGNLPLRLGGSAPLR